MYGSNFREVLLIIGEAMLAAKKELAVNDPAMTDVLLGWAFLGDPALVIES